MSFLNVLRGLLLLLFFLHGILSIYLVFLLNSLSLGIVWISIVEGVGSFFAVYGIWKQKVLGYVVGIAIGVINLYQLFRFFIVYNQDASELWTINFAIVEPWVNKLYALSSWSSILVILTIPVLLLLIAKRWQ